MRIIIWLAALALPGDRDETGTDETGTVLNGAKLR